MYLLVDYHLMEFNVFETGGVSPIIFVFIYTLSSGFPLDGVWSFYFMVDQQ